MTEVNLNPETVPIKNKKIIVNSVDFDGCLFHAGYCYSELKDRLIRTNPHFVDFILEQSKQEAADEIIFIVGSNRQSEEIDRNNSNWVKGSCFIALEELTKFFREKLTPLSCFANRYLLADDYDNVPHGENFSEFIKRYKKVATPGLCPSDLEDEGEDLGVPVTPEYDSDDDLPPLPLPPYKYGQWLFDDSKISILYTQMHKLASENPNAEIVYNFYDDRWDIYQPLADFFKKHPDLIPANVKLNIYAYSGSKTPGNIITLEGKGEIDFNYSNNLKLMAQKTLGVDQLSRKVIAYQSVNIMRGVGDWDVFKKERVLTRPVLKTENEAAISTGITVANEVAVANIETVSLNSTSASLLTQNSLFKVEATAAAKVSNDAMLVSIEKQEEASPALNRSAP